MAFSFSRLTEGLRKTQADWVARVKEVIGTKARLDSDLLESLEEILIAGDVGVETTGLLVTQLKAGFAKIDGSDLALEYLKDALVKQLQAAPDFARARPEIILLVGVNGSGKTTTAGKLAYRGTRAGEKVLLAACDTFRAAAIDQLKIWSERALAPLIAGLPEGDPAAVAHDATQAAVARGVDRLIIDTAGRLHTKSNLMAELAKIARVVNKVLPSAPHEVWLVLDATTGQNGLRQAKEFHRAVPLTGVVLTKLDGTSRGGIIFAVSKALGVPVRYVGLGEAAADLDTFDSRQFVDALFANSTDLIARQPRG
jgi:fused signal recognition particle receptor